MEAWAKPNDATAPLAILGTRYPSDQGFDVKFMDGNKIHADIGNGSSWLTTSADANFSYSAGQWVHIAIVVTPTGYTVYVNGENRGFRHLFQHSSAV